MTGIEPVTSCLGSRRSTAELHPHCADYKEAIGGLSSKMRSTCGEAGLGALGLDSTRNRDNLLPSGQGPTKLMAFTLLLSLIVIAQLLVLILGDKRVPVEAV